MVDRTETTPCPCDFGWEGCVCPAGPDPRCCHYDKVLGGSQTTDRPLYCGDCTTPNDCLFGVCKNGKPIPNMRMADKPASQTTLYESAVRGRRDFRAAYRATR